MATHKERFPFKDTRNGGTITWVIAQCDLGGQVAWEYVVCSSGVSQ